MAGRISVTERTYRALTERILSGAILPGARVDANVIAEESGVSPTPVRNALNRLVGAGLLVSQSNEGFFVPLCTEQDLRDLHNCCAEMLGLAIAGAVNSRKRTMATAMDDVKDSADIVIRTETTFYTIMSLCSNRYMRRVFADINARLRPARRLEGNWIANQHSELLRINKACEASDLADLAQRIDAYHRRRVRLAPKIVAHMHECDAA